MKDSIMHQGREWKRNFVTFKKKAYLLDGRNKALTAKTFNTEWETVEFCRKKNADFIRQGKLDVRMWTITLR